MGPARVRYAFCEEKGKEKKVTDGEGAIDGGRGIGEWSRERMNE